MCYLRGDGVPYGNFDEAFRLLSAAAEHNDPQALYGLAECYANGNGVAPNEAKAAAMLQRSAEQGFTESEYALGVFYKRGRGVAQDTEAARMWLTRAANKGHEAAKGELSTL